LIRGLRGWLAPRRRNVAVARFDEKAGRWTDVDAAAAVDRAGMTLATYNIWNDSSHAEQRYLAIAELLSRRAPDIAVFQEVTPTALDVFLEQAWIRRDYVCAAVVGGDAGTYGMLLLSRLPVSSVTYTRLPTRQSRGFLHCRSVLPRQQDGRLLHTSGQRKVVTPAAIMAAAQSIRCTEVGGKRRAARRFQHARRRKCAHRGAVPRHLARVEA
jgi:hypothetical protein